MSGVDRYWRDLAASLILARIRGMTDAEYVAAAADPEEQEERALAVRDYSDQVDLIVDPESLRQLFGSLVDIDEQRWRAEQARVVGR